MPIEIREIVIRARVQPDSDPGVEPPPDAPHRPAHSGALSEADHDRLVQDCVRQVMRQLAHQQDR